MSMYLTLLGTLLCGAGGTQVAADDVEEIESADVSVMTDEDTWFDVAYPVFDRTFNTLTARPARPGTFLAVIVHRTHKAVSKEPFYNYLGFDAGGLKIGLMV